MLSIGVFTERKKSVTHFERGIDMPNSLGYLFRSTLYDLHCLYVYVKAV